MHVQLYSNITRDTLSLQEKAKNKKERQTNRQYAKLANDPTALKVEVKANPSTHSDVC